MTPLQKAVEEMRQNSNTYNGHMMSFEVAIDILTRTLRELGDAVLKTSSNLLSIADNEEKSGLAEHCTCLAALDDRLKKVVSDFGLNEKG
jgi:hypothetical protein